MVGRAVGAAGRPESLQGQVALRPRSLQQAGLAAHLAKRGRRATIPVLVISIPAAHRLRETSERGCDQKKLKSDRPTTNEMIHRRTDGNCQIAGLVGDD